MPKRDPEEPKAIRVYTTHGVEFHNKQSKEWVGICPFCNKNKFHVDSETSKSDCKTCNWQEQFKEDGVSGNNYGFIRYLWRVSYNNTKPIDYEPLAKERNLTVEGLREWGVCKSVSTGEWLVPGYGIDTKPNIVQLYRYIRQYNGKYALWVTPGFQEGESHGVLLRQNHKNHLTGTTYICEGVWDGIAFSSVSDMVSERTNEKISIIAVPGAGILKHSWIDRYFSQENVVLLYDNDYPKKNSKTGTIQQSGLAGTKHAVGVICNKDKDKKISWLDWGNDGKGYDPSLADGYDVRDWLAKDHKSIDSLLSRVKPVPDEWIKEAIVKAKTISVGKSVQCVKCESWKELTDAFRLAAKWTPELNGALAVALSCIASVKGVGEPLWTRIISPPSTYKSQLCKALGTNTNYTIMDDGMNGFYSGMDTGDGVDHSLVTKWMGNTLITKEGSTLFTNKRSEEIIGQARAIYDGEIDRRWNNGKQCSHRGWHGTWLLCGTPTMKDYDDNELGPRFIDYMIVKDIDEQLEDDILMRAMVEQNSSGIANENIESSDNPNYLRARQLCGGYIEYLRDIVDNGKIPLPELDRLQLIQIGSLAKFIERMRGRPSKVPTSENTGLALAARVAKQLVKLSKFLCIVTQVKVIDSTIMAIVYKVAMDTSDGWSHEIVKSLRESELEGDDGLEPESIARKCKKNLKEISSLLNYLPKIGVTELYAPIDTPSPIRQYRMRLTDSFRILYNQVMSMRY